MDSVKCALIDWVYIVRLPGEGIDLCPKTLSNQLPISSEIHKSYLIKSEKRYSLF